MLFLLRRYDDRRASSGYSRNSASSRPQRSSYTSNMSGYQGYKVSRDNSDLRKVSNSSTESDSCFGSYTEESRSMGEMTRRMTMTLYYPDLQERVLTKTGRETNTAVVATRLAP